MEIRQLQYFVSVAEEQHFTRAAERLMISQSGLSAAIRALEKELQAALFVRTTRRVTLTEAGRALLVEAERILAQERAAREAVAAVQGVLRGTLTLGAEQCVPGVHVAGLLASFRRRHPQVEIRLRQWGSAALAAGVGAGSLDVAFAYRTEVDVEQLRSIPLTSVPMIVLCHPDHALAQAGASPTPKDLAGETFVDFQQDWGPRRVTDAAFAALGMRRSVALEVNDVHSLLELVDEGLGIAVVPRHFRCKRPRLSALPLRDDGGAVYETAALLPAPEATSPAAQALLALLDEETDAADGPAASSAGFRGSGAVRSS